MALAETRFGGLDGAFNNAGIIGDMGPVPDMAVSNWHKVMAVNLNSGFYAAKFQILRCVNAGWVNCVHLHIRGAHNRFTWHGGLRRVQTGLIGMTQVLAVENGPENIRVNALLPGGTMTPMAGDDAGTHDVVRGFHALKRMAEPSEIADAALFLLSDQASFVTGSAMIVDGELDK